MLLVLQLIWPVRTAYFKTILMVNVPFFSLIADTYFDDYDFEDRPVLEESPRINEFDTHMYIVTRKMLTVDSQIRQQPLSRHRVTKAMRIKCL